MAPLTTRIETERLVLRPPDLGDAAALRELLIRSADHLRPWSPAPAPGRDPAALSSQRALIEHQREEWRRDRTYAFLLEPRAGGAPLGRITLSQVFRGPFLNASLGYWIAADAQGSGYTTEAVRAVVRFAFGPLGLHRVQAGTLPHNAASQRVLLKAGFTQEGYAKNYLRIAGRWQDHVLFAITSDEPAG